MLKLTELLITRWAEITARYDVRSNEKWNRPFAAKPSRGLLFIKLWAATLRMPEMEKACRKHQNGQALGIKKGDFMTV